MFILIFIYVCYILGGLISKGIFTGNDLNDITEQGSYGINLDTGNMPINYYGTLFYIKGYSTKDGIQIFKNLNSNNGQFLYFRVRDENGVWGAWEKFSTDIPTFYKYYADLSSLANALGVAYKSGVSYNLDDIDNCINAGMYVGYKDGIGVSSLIVFTLNDFIIQFELREASGIRYRVSYSRGSVWGTWMNINIT